MKKLTALTAAVLLLLSLTACGDIVIQDQPAAAPAAEIPAALSEEIAPAEATEIKLTGNSAELVGGGAAVNGTVITVSAAGEYRVSGELANGCIIVNTGEDAQKVTLILDGASISCADGPAIKVEQAKKLTIRLADSSVNTLVSGTGTQLVKADETAQGAVIFSEDDLVIEGSGSLDITGILNNGITGKDDVKILGGILNINAANNGIRGSESVTVEGGNISVTAMNDGIKSTSAVKEGKGFVTINGGSVTITADGDGISSAAELTVNDGSISVHSVGGELYSGKSIKSDGAMTINGGELQLVSENDKCLSSDSDININSGSIVLSAGKSGVSSRTGVYLNGGSLELVSLGDGIRAGEKGGSIGTVSLNGSTVRISSAIDPIDAKGGFEVSSGSLIAAGNAKHLKNLIRSDMACLQFVSSSQISAKTEAVITAGSGYSVSITPDRGYKLVVVIAPELASGMEYTLTAGRTTLNSNAA